VGAAKPQAAERGSLTSPLRGSGMPLRWFPCLALVGALLLAGCGGAQPPPPPVPPPQETPGGTPVAASRPGGFTDRTPSSGLHFSYRNGEEADRYTTLELVGGGVALIDYDRDGLLDIFVTGGGEFGPNDTIRGHPNRLFRNEGNWHFRDVTAEVGLPLTPPPLPPGERGRGEGDGPLFYSHGCAVADYDNDGWPDLLVTGYGRMALDHHHHAT